MKLKRYKSIFKEFAEKSDEDKFIDNYEQELVKYLKQNNLYKYGGNGPQMAIEQYAKKKRLNLKGLDLQYIVDNIWWS